MRSLENNKKFEEHLAMAFKKIKPDIVFLPFWFDNHTDHRAVSKALIKIKQKIRLNFIVYAYPVSTQRQRALIRAFSVPV
jgi:LmbE family N-acetylglucosaminyl deacetylase